MIMPDKGSSKKSKKEKEPKLIPGTCIEVIGLVPGELRKFVMKIGREWNYATTVIRENQALKLGTVFFGNNIEDVLTCPAYVYPEKHRVVPREKLKPIIKT